MKIEFKDYITQQNFKEFGLKSQNIILLSYELVLLEILDNSPWYLQQCDVYFSAIRNIR